MEIYKTLLFSLRPFLLSIVVTIAFSCAFYLFIWKFNFFKSVKYYSFDKIKKNQIFFEILHLTVGYIFVGVYLSIVNYILFKFQLTKTYSSVNQYGYLWLGISIVILFLIHDTYAFWTHRLMHTIHFFEKFHLLHHRSVYVTSFSAFSFSIREFILTFSWLPLIKMCIPIHERLTLIYAIFFIFFNSLAHCGLRVYPKSWFVNFPFRYLNFDHHIHHQNVQVNHGLYFSFWDRFMGTYQKYPLKVLCEDES